MPIQAQETHRVPVKSETGIPLDPLTAKPMMTKLPRVHVQLPDGRKEWMIQAATFVAVPNQQGKVPENYSITVTPTFEDPTRERVRGIPGTCIIAGFDQGQYVTEWEEVAEALIAHPEFLVKYRPHPNDPTRFWRDRGYVEEVQKTVTEQVVDMKVVKRVRDEKTGEMRLVKPVETVDEPKVADAPPKRKPGRPPKAKVAAAQPKRGPGRPRKVKPVEE